MSPTLTDIQKAAELIRPFIHRTPIFTCSTFNNMLQANLFFKCENFQKIGAFKIRGASNAVLSLSDKEAQRGVATHSSGNHGAALALAARNRGIPAYIIMPEDSPEVKKQAVRGYGANITFCKPGLPARIKALEEVVAETRAIVIHPYDNEKIIAGQGTVALELLEQCPNLDMVIVPIGGGGLIAGISIVVKALAPHISIIGAEPVLADDAYQSFKKKELIHTFHHRGICDGLLASLGKITFPIILDNVTNIYTATEESILLAIKNIWERMKIVVEPSAAISLAIMLEHPQAFANKNIGVILSGGNVDIKAIATLLP